MQKSSAMNVFCKNVTACLEAKNWTVQHLADECGMKRPSLSRILHGKIDVRLSTAQSIADALKIALPNLLSETFQAKKHAA